MARPCPFVGCRYHLYEVDREGRRGRPAEARAEPEEELAAMPETCALDVAARQREKMSLDGEPLAHAAIGQILGLSRETVKKIEASALASLRAGARSFLAASPIADEMGDEEAAPDLLSLATSTGYMPLGFE